MVTSGFCSTASWCDRPRPASAPSIWSARRGFVRPNRGRILVYEPKRDLLAHYRTGPLLYSPKYNLLCRLRPRRRWWQAVVWGGSPGPVVERLCYLAVVAVAVSILPTFCLKILVVWLD